jgi:hypothetical protein
MQRRVLLQGVLAGQGVLAAGVLTADAAVASTSDEAASEHAPVAPGVGDELDPWALFHPIAPGDEIGLGWCLAEVSDVTQGGIVLTLRRDEQEARVHLCRKEGRGVAQSEGFDLMLMNHGTGKSPTDEELGRAIKTLAEIVADNERRGVAAPSLLPHSLRLSWYGRHELV